MYFSQEDLQYIAGEKFHNSYKMRLYNNRLYSRIEQILEIVKDKKVLHIGCCDHLELIENKIKHHIWLQGLLDEKCTDVLGIDIDDQATSFVNTNKLSINPVLCGDVTKYDFTNYNIEKYDYVLLGEILEHVDNPVQFLSEMKKNLSQYGFKGEFIITVPNAFCFLKGYYLKGIEFINTDHRYWFTPYTIGKVMYRAGMMPKEILFVDGPGRNGKNRLSNKLFSLMYKISHKPSKYNSYRSETLIAIGE